MKNLILFLLGISFLVSGCSPAKVDMEAEKTNVRAVLDKVVQATKNENMEMFSQTTAHDKDLISIGTAGNEFFKGWEQLKEAMLKQFDAFENTDILVKDRIIKIHASGKVAWFSEVLDFKFTVKEKPYQFEGVRFSGVLEKRDNKWLVVQTHMSVPVKEEL